MKYIDKLLEYTVGFLLFLMAVIVVLQIFFRLCFNISIYWTFEVSTFLFTWIIFLGASIGFKRKSHFSITLIIDKFSPNIKIIINNFINIIVTIFLVVVIKYGFDLMSSSRYQISPSLRIPMYLIYSVVPLGSIVMLFYLWKYRKVEKYKDIEEEED